MHLYTASWTVAHGLAGWSGTQEEHDCKIVDKEIWEREMLVDHYE